MLKEIDDKSRLEELAKILDEFLNNSDCSLDCDNCIHNRLCGQIYILNNTLNRRYIGK